jgi:hypothetical protein
LWNGLVDVTDFFPEASLVDGRLTVTEAPREEAPSTPMIIRYNSNHTGKGGAELYFTHSDMLSGGYVVGDRYTVKSYTHPMKVSSDRWVLPGNYADLVFTGWNTKPDGSGTHFNPGDMLQVIYAANPLSAIETIIGATSSNEPLIISLYAQWKPAEEEVTKTKLVKRAPKTGDAVESSLLMYSVLALLSTQIIAIWFALNRIKVRNTRNRRYRRITRR